jgi:hypothetical protein
VAFTDEGGTLRESYVNLIPTVAGGTHESGLKDGLFGAIKGFIELHSLLPKGVKLMPDDVFSRASFVLSAKVLDPQFQGQIKERLNSRDAVRLVGSLVRAQLELGLVAWRSRKVEKSSDIRAVYWLQKAAGLGSREAKVLLERIAPPVRKAEWAHAARAVFNRDTSNQYPFLAARVELGYWFGLTRAEALLIDIEAADHGHCLEVDIREQHPRSRRRLVQIATGDQRAALDRVVRMFDAVEAKGVAGQEGNYRQRLYRFRSLLTQRRAQRVTSPSI